MKRIVRVSCVLMAVCLLSVLTGCSMPKIIFNPEELYSLPVLPVKYTELNSRISEILENEAEYAAPTAGTNIQPVQLVDLDSDGREEAVAFFRKPADEKPLKIYIFTAEEESYSQTGLIEGTGTAISSISYNDLDGDGMMELVIGWKATAELQVLEVYRHQGSDADPLVRTNYVKYMDADLDQDGKKELIVLRADEEGSSVADYYNWQKDGTLARQVPARISVTMAELSQQGRVSAGVLRDEVPALFVTGVTDAPIAITDILTLRNSELTNIVLSEQTGVSGEIAFFSGLYPADINGDGMTDVPRPLLLEEQAGSSHLVEWYSYDRSGEAVSQIRTCHNITDRWYFQMPEEWRGMVGIQRTTASGEAAVTFFLQETDEPVLRISMYNGGNREMKAVQGEQFLLSRQAETLYTAELLEANADWQYGLTADEVRAAFSLITPEWTTGVN